MSNPHRTHRAMTVMEVVVIAAMLLVVSAFAVPHFTGAGANAGESQSKASISATLDAVVAFRTDGRTFTTSSELATALDESQPRNTHDVGESTGPDEVSVDYDTSTEDVSVAVRAGSGSCWMAQMQGMSSDTPGQVVYAVAEAGSAVVPTCNGVAAATFAVIDEDVPDRGDRPSRPVVID